MTVRPHLASRLVYGIGGGSAALIFIGLGIYAFVSEPNSLKSGVGLLAAAALGGFLAVLAYWGGVGTELRADATTVGLYPPIGSVKVSPRDRVGSIARVAGLKGVITYKLVSRDGISVMETGASYRRSDLEQFAQFIDVPLRWDADK